MIFIQVVKCGDRDCCSEPRSDLFKFLKQFVPAPLCITQNGLQIKGNSDEGNEFTSLFLRLSLSDSHLGQGTVREVPFDYCCPSVTDLIKVRTCQTCGIYHATKKSLAAHNRICKSTRLLPRPHPTLDDSFLRIRPQRIAAQRQRV